MYQILLGQFNGTCIAHLLSRGSRNIRQVNQNLTKMCPFRLPIQLSFI